MALNFLPQLTAFCVVLQASCQKNGIIFSSNICTLLSLQQFSCLWLAQLYMESSSICRVRK